MLKNKISLLLLLCVTVHENICILLQNNMKNVKFGLQLYNCKKVFILNHYKCLCKFSWGCKELIWKSMNCCIIDDVKADFEKYCPNYFYY